MTQGTTLMSQEQATKRWTGSRKNRRPRGQMNWRQDQQTSACETQAEERTKR